MPLTVDSARGKYEVAKASLDRIQTLLGYNKVIAPMDVRLERVMERGYDEIPGPLSRDKARDAIRRADRDTAGFMRYLFNIDWMDPQHWDIVLNTGRFSVESGFMPTRATRRLPVVIPPSTPPARLEPRS